MIQHSQDNSEFAYEVGLAIGEKDTRVLEGPGYDHPTGLEAQINFNKV